MGLLMLPVYRPVAVAMFFLGVVLLGGIAWQRLPLELLPVLQGDQLFVNFQRPGSDPEIIERELLLPLQAQVAALSGISETFGEIRGAQGNYIVSLEPGVDVKVRELELQRIVSELQREQPPGTWMNVRSSGTGGFASFVMMVHVLGPGEDRNALYDLVEQSVLPRFASVPGVSQALVSGGASRQVTIDLDPARAVAMGMTTEDVMAAVRKNVGRLRFVGNLEAGDGRTAVVLDGRPASLAALGEVRIKPDRPVLLHHVADVDYGYGLQERLSRVNGQPAIGVIVFQEQGANLVRLGRALRAKVAEVQPELQSQGLDLVIGFDAAESVEEQIERLSGLGLTGFAIALLVLFFFLRQWRAVAVVAVAVPISLLAALAMLYLVGQSLNLVSLFGLALAIGLVVDNSVVVFEAVQRHLERGSGIEDAVREGLRRTVRAILAASATTAVVFLPLTLVEFEEQMIGQLSKVVAISILLPLTASLVVAIGLVPLLAQRLAAPAARNRLEQLRARRAARGGFLPPDPARILFGGLVKGALRHPPAWITGIIVAVFFTLAFAVPWVAVNSSSREAPDADSVQLAARFPTARGSIEAASRAMGRVEAAVLAMPGVESVETLIQEDGGSITVQLVDREDRPPGVRAQHIRAAIRKAAREIKGLDILRPGEEQRGEKGAGNRGGGRAFGGGPAEIVVSGPDSAVLQTLAGNVRAQLESMPFITGARISTRPGVPEFWVEPDRQAFESLGLSFSQVLPTLRLTGREGQRLQSGFVASSGRELPVVVERRYARVEGRGRRDMGTMRVQTEVGVVPITSLATMRIMPPPQVIAHHNGRREIAVNYRLREDIPDTGPTRLAVEDQIAAAVRSVPRPPGTTIETVDQDQSTDMAEQILVPAVLLLYLVLAMTFESLSLPILVLLALPLTLLGATWALAIGGIAFSQMAVLGALTLIGLTVNPGILLVDRMQQLVRRGRWSTGAAAVAAVRERTRPVLMTTATTVAGLWPLSISTGRENEIWPPFATVVIGGLITSSLLTLMIMPVGFVLLRRLDDLFGRVGPWLVLTWLVTTTLTMGVLIFTETIVSVFWQFALSLLVGGVLLAIVVILFRPRDLAEPESRDDGPPRLEVRHLYKYYGLHGPVRSAILAPRRFALMVARAGIAAFQPGDARDRLLPLALATGAIAYAALQVSSMFWTLVLSLVAAALARRFAIELRRARGLADDTGQVLPGGVEHVIAAVAPWVAIVAVAVLVALPPVLAGQGGLGRFILPILAAVAAATLYFMRRTAHELAAAGAGRGTASLHAGDPRTGDPRTGDPRTGDPHTGDPRTAGPRVGESFQGLRKMWRSWSARVGGVDLPVPPTRALAGINFTVDRGMVGVLGPNGAGKTTLLRQLAGVMDPTRGTIRYGDVRLGKIQRYLARWVGYLPQDTGLPDGMSPREYLTWYGALYDLEPGIRGERVAGLLEDVGLTEKADDRIKALSGGMRQRVAVARTLLRLPPVIIVDEPTVGLDPRERIRFRNLLSRLARDRIVLMSTHVVEDVAVACERVLVLAGGELIFDGKTEALTAAARGCVWEIRTAVDEELDLPADAYHTEERPTPDGHVLHRVLAGEMPHPTAEPLEATLEDGYLWLVESAARRIRSADPMEAYA